MQNRPTKKMVKEYVRKRLANEDKMAIKALLMVFNHQTSDEQSTDRTRYQNNVGFTAFDAEFLTKLAKQYQEKNWLSVKQLAILKKIMPKYWKQVIDACDYHKLEDMAYKNYVNNLEAVQENLNI